jgi:hypothetical protein
VTLRLIRRGCLPYLEETAPRDHQAGNLRLIPGLVLALALPRNCAACVLCPPSANLVEGVAMTSLKFKNQDGMTVVEQKLENELYRQGLQAYLCRTRCQNLLRVLSDPFLFTVSNLSSRSHFRPLVPGFQWLPTTVSPPRYSAVSRHMARILATRCSSRNISSKSCQD